MFSSEYAEAIITFEVTGINGIQYAKLALQTPFLGSCQIFLSH